MYNINIKLLVFGLNAEYDIFILLSKDNQVPSTLIEGTDIKKLVNSLFESIFNYSALFSPALLSDISLVDNTLNIYFYTTVPQDTLTNKEYKWVKPYETIHTKFDQDNRIKLPIQDYQAIHTSLGRRQYTYNKPE